MLRKISAFQSKLWFHLGLSNRLGGALVLLTIFYLALALAFESTLPLTTAPDTRQYDYVATLPLFSTDFWLDWRPTTTPLLLKIFGRDHAMLAAFQFIIAKLAWILLGLGLIVNLRHKALKVGGYIAALFLSMATDFALVYGVILTEGIAYSLFVLVIALWLLTLAYLRERPNLSLRGQTLISLGLALAMFFWASSRYPNTLIMLGGVSFLSLVLLVGWRRLPQWRLILAIVIAAGGATFLFQSGPVSASDYWQQALMNALAEKVLPYPERRDFFIERGMPGTEEALAFAGYVPARYYQDWDEIYGAWLDDNAQRTYYVDYLLLRPLPRIAEMFSNWERVFSPDMVTWRHGRQSPNGDLNAWAQKLNYLYYDPSAPTFGLIGLAALLLIGLNTFNTFNTKKRRRWDGRYWLPLLILVLALPSALSLWYGDAYYERVYISTSIQTKVGVLLLALFALDATLSRLKGAKTRHWPSSALIALILITGALEALGGVAWSRKNILYPIMSSVAPNTNLLRPWGVSDLEYRLFQHAEIGTAVLSLQQEVVKDEIYYREFVIYWGENGTHGELREDKPAILDIAWRNSGAPFAVAGPKGPVLGGFPYPPERAAPLMAWRENRLPGNLAGEEISYLHVDSVVFDTLPAYEVGVLQNPALYQKVAAWGDENTPQILYRVVGDTTAWLASDTLLSAEVNLLGEAAGRYSELPLTLVDEDAIIFDPRTGAEANRAYHISYLSKLINLTQPSGETLDALLNLLQVAERAQYQNDLAGVETEINLWRGDKAAEHLRDAGVTHLLVDADWLSWLSEAELAQLNDPTQYDLILNWANLTPEGYRLYAIQEE